MLDLSALLSLPLIILVITLSLLTSGYRYVIENVATRLVPIVPDKWEPWIMYLWREVILPITPILLGLVFGYLVSDYSWPVGFENLSGRLMLGGISGLLASWIYPRILYHIRAYLYKQIGDENE